VSHGHQGQSLTTNRKNAESMSTIHDFIFYHVTSAVRGYLLNLDSELEDIVLTGRPPLRRRTILDSTFYFCLAMGSIANTRAQ
jgi:hypothetical protein